MRILLLPTLLAGLLFATTASAAPAKETSAQAVPTESHWYGGRILLADGAALTLAIASFHGSDNWTMTKTAWLSYTVTPAVLHTVHGRWERGLISAGLRAALPLGMATLLSAASSCGPEEWFCGVGEFAGGFLLGALGASVADQFLAQDQHPVADARSFAILPTLQPTRGGATAGLVGVF